MRQYILVPALFKQRHLEPMPYKIGYIPSRSLSIFIFIYVSLNIIFSAADIHLVWPTTWWDSKRIEIANNVADRTGVLSIANLALTILFSGRNTLIIQITGWSQNTTLTFHRWAARVTALQAIVHSIVYSIQFYWKGGAEEYYAEMAFPGYYWGAVGTVALAIILPFAILPLRAKFYEVFLLLHIVLAVVALVGTWYHIYLTYGAENYYGFQVWLFIAFAFWGFDRVIRLVRLAILNRAGRSEASFELLPGGKFVQITVFPKVEWKVQPGQHIFIYMTQLGKVWENHPFTIANYGLGAFDRSRQDVSATISEPTPIQKPALTDPEHDVEKSIVSNVITCSSSPASESSSSLEPSDPKAKDSDLPNRFYIRFLCRVHAGMTASLRARVANPATNDTKDTTLRKVLLEGPYGSHSQARRPLETADVVLCIAGGIGVTHTLGYVQRYAEDALIPVDQRRSCMRHTQRLVFAWTAREPELIQHVRENLLPVVRDFPGNVAGRRLEYQFWITGIRENGRNVERDGTVLETGQRMDVAEVLGQVLSPTGRVVVVVCGPGGLADVVRAQVARSIGQCKSLDLVEEAFGW
jgi:predicted ferric reductase